MLLPEARLTLFFDRLAAVQPLIKTELESTNVYTLLVAVMLSAQMTDSGVNKATKPLFEKIRTPQEMIAFGEDNLRTAIRSINYYNTKARHVIEASKLLVEKFGGTVPSTREELELLPGVGRKTANVVLNVAFDQPTMPVDTHVFRVANRTGLSEGKNVREVEDELLERVPAFYALTAHHYLILHGRYVCVARNPKCESCPVLDFCPRNGLPPLE